MQLRHFDLLYLLITVVPMGVQTSHSRMSWNPFKNKIFKEKHQFMLLTKFPVNAKESNAEMFGSGTVKKKVKLPQNTPSTAPSVLIIIVLSALADIWLDLCFN